VSERLANTPAICRKSYVHQAVMKAFEGGKLKKFSDSLKGRRSPVLREKLLAQLVTNVKK
jgi:DNA topoisomerase-1